MNMKLLAKVISMVVAYAPVGAFAVMIGFEAGIEINGGFGITNTSDSATIQSLTITLTHNDTFFDTAPTPPGTASRGWSVVANFGVGTVSLPSNAATDGQQMATVSFAGFDPGESLQLDFDLDLFSAPDFSGAPAGGSVSVLFSSGHTLIGTFASAPSKTIAGSSWTIRASDSLTLASTVPEPSTILLLGIGGGLAYRVWRRGRRVV